MMILPAPLVHRRRAIAPAIFTALSATTLCGCAARHYTNPADFLEHHILASHDSVVAEFLRCWALYTGRDILTLDPLTRRLFGDPAWNADGDGVRDGSFYTNRTRADLSPGRLARGAGDTPAPRPSYSILQPKAGGATPGFIGRDALGRKFLFKLDQRDYPELGTAADLPWIAERIRALGPLRLEAVVGQARLSDPADARQIVDTLTARRRMILRLVANDSADRSAPARRRQP